jgi:hypothetical protein
MKLMVPPTCAENGFTGVELCRDRRKCKVMGMTVKYWQWSMYGCRISGKAVL